VAQFFADLMHSLLVQYDALHVFSASILILRRDLVKRTRILME
jgi:hypothetical protein